MKAVFLDWATMGPGLDVSRLSALLPALNVFQATGNDEIAVASLMQSSSSPTRFG